MYALDYAARSDVGLVRASNQDSAYAGPNLLLVADGMGGHAGGDVASAMAVAAIDHLDKTPHKSATALGDLEDAMEEARLALVHASATTPRLAGLGTTVVALLRTENMLALGHMGDSRAYLLRDGELRQVTVDHTFVQHLVDTGRIAPEEAAHHPNRNVVMRVLSDFDVDLHADLFLVDAEIGDRWLLCSDGLSGFVELPELQEILAKGDDPPTTAEALIEAAKHAASTDNITALVADIVPTDLAPADAVEVVGAAATGGPMPELIGRSIDAVRLLPQPNLAASSDDDAVPMSPQDFAADGLIDANRHEEPPAPPTDPVLAVGVTPDLPAFHNAETAPIELPADWPHAAPTPEAPAQVIAPVAVAAAPRPVQVLDQPVLFVDPEEAAFSAYDDDDRLAREAPRRHPILLAAAIIGALALLGFAAWRGYAWTQNQYYVGQLAGRVAIFRGLPQNLGPITLHQAVELLDTEVADLPQHVVSRLEGTIPADSLADARERADRLIADALDAQPAPASGPTPTVPGAQTTVPTLRPPPATTPPPTPQASPQTGNATL